MNKGLISTAIGIVFLLGGGGVLFYFMNSPEQTRSTWFLGIAIVFLVAGLFFLARGLAKPIAALTGIENVSTETEQPAPKTDGTSLLEKNNQMLSQWSKVNQTKDKLKILQMAANEEADSTKK